LTKKVNLLSNTFYSGIGNASSIFLLLVLVFAGRLLGAAEFGKFTFSLALVTTVSLLSDFGVSTLVQRTVARNPERAESHFGNLLTLKVILSLLAILISMALVFLLKPELDVRITVFVLALAAALKSLKMVPITFFQALGRFDLFALSYVFHNFGFFVFGTLALWRGASLITFVCVFVVFKSVDTAISYVLAHKSIGRTAPRFDFSFMKRLQIEALPLGVYVLINEIYSYMDTILLSVLRSDAEVGWYNGAYKIFEGLSVFPLILSQAMFPQLSRLHKTDESAHRTLAARTLKFGAMAAGLVAVSGIVVGRDLVLFLFGTAYNESIPVLEILLVTFLFVFLNMIFQMILITIDRQRAMPWMGLAGFGTIVLAGFLLIPHYGHLGAAFAYLASEFVLFLIGFFYLYRFCFQSWFLWAAAKPLIAGLLILGAFPILHVEKQFAHVFLVVPTYMFLLFLLHSFDKEDLGSLRRIFNADRFKAG
jgi:O-antigen/teichoic acid export membrane protein